MPSLGGTESEENSYSFGNSDKIHRYMQLPHLFREHFRTYNILDTILSSAEIKTNKHNPCPQRTLQPCGEISIRSSKISKEKLIFKNGNALQIMLVRGEEVVGVMKLKKNV